MELDELARMVRASFDDQRLSRGERQDLTPLIRGLGPEAREALRREVFSIARGAVSEPSSLDVLGWLDDLTRLLHLGEVTATRPATESHFSPGDGPLRRVIGLFEHARSTADVCVFTITDDRIAGPILDAHRRGLRLRIITDNEKAEDLGSDVGRFEAAGIAVRVDRTSFHMHHKFAIFDRSTLLTGSYNWTRGAAEANEENIVVLSDPAPLDAFQKAFDRLWERLG